MNGFTGLPAHSKLLEFVPIERVGIISGPPGNIIPARALTTVILSHQMLPPLLRPKAKPSSALSPTPIV
ncbi:hypothetical protein HBI56_093430 [Parastagonospora nodorum]|nr:hypothetical protein HBH53_140430 [Parastagonospora nodorum]KAH3966188.1 hypothetical protein HBH51_144940 [Parastagonospora nodorum]KAH3989278.1 hypothetical protein HBH52_019930 [Parastagonospora nodorum]KAH3998345.1 hypothetical protein HBI10_132800 [Parastagonospora nodorum]KAH4029938.1 hypothetical protein HBI13_034800 [Parastagonospora nodorum]